MNNDLLIGYRLLPISINRKLADNMRRQSKLH